MSKQKKPMGIGLDLEKKYSRSEVKEAERKFLDVTLLPTAKTTNELILSELTAIRKLLENGIGVYEIDYERKR